MTLLVMGISHEFPQVLWFRIRECPTWVEVISPRWYGPSFPTVVITYLAGSHPPTVFWTNSYIFLSIFVHDKWNMWYLYPMVLMLRIGITSFFPTGRLSRQWRCHCFQETPIASTPMSWSDAIAKPPNGPSEGRQEGEGWVFGLDDLSRFGEILKQIFQYGCDVHVCNVVVCYFMVMSCNGMPCHAMACHVMSSTYVCVCMFVVCMVVCMYMCFFHGCL